MFPNDGAIEGALPDRVATTQGWVYLKSPPLDLVKRLDALLPLGLRVFEDNDQGARFGIVMRDGPREIRLLKQQPPEVPDTDAGTVLMANRILVAACLAQFQVEEGEGLFWPLFYRRDKPQGVEAGIAYLGRGNDPSLAGVVGTETAFDNDFSPGFTRAMTRFIEILKAESQITGITMQPCIGLDVRPTDKLGHLEYEFLMLDGEVVCLKTEISSSDPIWTVIRSEGIESVIHLPASLIVLQI